LVRGTVVAMTAVLLGAGGHAAVTRMIPSRTALLVATCAALVVGIGLSGRRWSLPALLAVLGGAQLAFHVALSGPHDMGTMHDASGHPYSGSLMLAAHVLAAGVSAGVLERSEDWCARVVDVLTRPSWRPVLVHLAPVTSSPLPETGVPHPVGRRWWAESHQRRGPPASPAA
jgi:hypothetical protein